MKILVIGGGISNEREISLRSSNSIFNAVQKAGYNAQYYDWDGTNQWLNTHAKNFEVILPILHGQGGEDGQIQKLLEKIGVPFLGSDSVASDLCFNKQRCKEFLSSNGITVPHGEMVNFSEYLSHRLYQQPHVLKPYDGGSSIDTFIYSQPNNQDLKAVRDAFNRHNKLLIEEFVAGVEITLPILDGKTMPVIEVIPPKNEVFDYDNKYNNDRTKIYIPSKSIPMTIQKEIIHMANEVHNLLNCRHLSRIDMIYHNNQPYVLEVNTMPGMTDHSFFPRAASYIGMDLPQFVDYLICMARNL